MGNIDNFNEYFNKVNEGNEIESYIETSYDYQWVDTETVWRFREFDRSKPNEDRADSQKSISELSYKLQEGFNEPLIMQYSHKYKTAYLIEGNHRLLVARKLGYKYVPIRVTIDGHEKRDAQKVVGYYASINDKVDPRLPSQIGIPNCYDKNFKPVKSEDEAYEEEMEIDFEKLPDVKRYTRESSGLKIDVIEFKPLKGSYYVHFLFNSDDFDYIDNLTDNDNTLYKTYGNSLWDILDYEDSYFTDEMKKRINLPYSEDESLEGYKDFYEMYFYEDFPQKNHELYTKEIARVLWEKMRKHGLSKISVGCFESPFGGTVDFLNSDLTESFDFEPKTYKRIPNGKYYFSYDGVVFENENIDDYQFDGDETTFEEILKKNYDYRDNINMDFNELEDYTIHISELDIDNIFK
jgi:hypothetical protein